MRLPANANANLLLLPLSALLLLFSVGHALPAIFDPLLSSSSTSPPPSIANVAGQVKCSTNAACIALGQPLLRPKIKRQDSASASQVFTYTGSVQSFLPPVTGTYFISVSAAQGGNGIPLFSALGAAGGLGAQVNATYQLAAGDVVDVYVGQQGVGSYVAGGGGGSFVYLNDAVLVASGGGSGGSEYGRGIDASIVDLTGNGQDGEGPSAGAGGTNGNGGGQATYDYDGNGYYYNGGSGAGVYSDGATGAGAYAGNGGTAKAGGFGGGSGTADGYAGSGGYGGGGGANPGATGAGGGYSGGGGASGAGRDRGTYYRGGAGGSWASQAGRVVEPVVSLHGGGGDGLVVIYQVL